VENVLVNGERPGRAAVGSQVALSATLTGTGPFDPTARFGNAYVPAPDGKADVTAPSTPGLYLAEIVVGAPYGPLPMEGGGDSMIMPPEWTSASAIAGTEVVVE
jgi:hypothetical protein